MTIAEQMGVTLQSTAYSVNVKERLDFSCAAVRRRRRADRQRPAHAGASGLDGRVGAHHHRAERSGAMRPGDVCALNNPYNGGTHLPDITVVMPVFDGRRRVLFFVAARAATMPTSAASRRARCRPTARTSTRKACCSTISSWSRTASCARRSCWSCCASGRYPVRNATQNVADLQAQVAACRAGRQRAGRDGRRSSAAPRSRAYMGHVQDNAEESVRRVLDVLQDGEFTYAHDAGAGGAGSGSRSTRRRGGPRSTSPAPARSSPGTSTRPPRSPAPPCCMSSARWSTTTSR